MSIQSPNNVVSCEVLEKIFLIQRGNNYGSSFAYKVGSKQYLITAKHLFTDIANDDSFKIKIFHDGQWKSIRVKAVVLESIENYDAIALELNTPLISDINYILSADSLTLGQDLYFLGFPYGLYSPSKINRGFPLPLVKKGCLSGINFNGSFAELIIDGHNNPGFSGGPIVTQNIFTGNIQIIGIIHAFRKANQETGENSGIFFAHDPKPLQQFFFAVVLDHLLSTLV